jgi:hypothetical protein
MTLTTEDTAIDSALDLLEAGEWNLSSAISWARRTGRHQFAAYLQTLRTR